jgi:hypothetical protein
MPAGLIDPLPRNMTDATRVLFRLPDRRSSRGCSFPPSRRGWK